MGNVHYMRIRKMRHVYGESRDFFIFYMRFTEFHETWQPCTIYSMYLHNTVSMVSENLFTIIDTVWYTGSK